MSTKSDLNVIHENSSATESSENINSDVPNGNITITVDVDKSDSCHSDRSEELSKENGEISEKKIENGNTPAVLEVSNVLLNIPLPNMKNRNRMSFMEEESAKEKLRLALLKQCAAILKQGDQRYTKETLHRTFQDVDLLERIYRLFDADNEGYLVQEDFFEFLKQRLTGDKQIDFVEQVESVAYVLCGNDVITIDAFQHILQNKVVTSRLFRMLDADGDGYTTADEVMEFISTVSSSRPRVGFDKGSVDRLEDVFRKTVGDEKEITKEQFRRIMESKNPFFTERVFQILDEDNSGAISLQEFIASVHRFAGDTEDKIRLLFKVYDIDNDGLIQHRELQHVMRVCMEENGMQFSENQLLELTAAMFEDADTEGRGAITYEAFKQMLEMHGGLIENISTSIDRWLVPAKVDSDRFSLLQTLKKLKPYQLSLPYMRNNYALLSYLGLFLLVNIVLFATRCYEYRKDNGFVVVARGCGQCLNFTCAWILVLMLRNCITALRVRGLGSILPLDHHIYLHKVTGVLICLYSILHTVMHLCNFSIKVVNDPIINSGNYTLSEWLLTTRPGKFGLVGGWANPTGLALALLLAVMFISSQGFVRSRGSFKIFYWMHLLYIPFWMVLILHGPHFYKWFALPGAVYITERILRYVWMMSERSKTYISSGILLPSRVTYLEIRRPPHFMFHAGDYVFVNIPAIAFYEWHPFTISSAPEREGYISLHIRGVGEWTNRLHSYFEKEQARLSSPAPVPALAIDNAHEKLARTSSSLSNKSKKSLKFGSLRAKRVLESAKFIDHGFENDSHLAGERVQPAPHSPISPASGVTSRQRALEKSRSMPDVNKKANKFFSKSSMRSESERKFDSRTVTPSKPEYVSPYNKDLEHKFRYMRTKPPIIAFETPSLMDLDRRRSNESIITLARRRLSKTISPDKDVESLKMIEENKEAATQQTTSPKIGKPLEIYIDGPYGAASSHIFQAEHAVLIAAGIGVTPFASILQAIMFRYWEAKQTCPNCSHTWTASLHSHNMKLRKVDFFWINREQRSFEWFLTLLSQLEMEQAEQELAMAAKNKAAPSGGEADGGGDEENRRFLEMHMYITSALQRSDMKAVGLQLALHLLHQKEKRDLITGLRTRTNAGRPNWDKVFQQLQEQHKGKVTVFYCGPPQLAKTLKIKCSQYGFNFRKEVF